METLNGNLKPNKRKDGATLVEVLVYLALFAMIFVTFIRLFWYVSENNQRATYRGELDRSSMFVFEHLNTVVDNASSINDELSSFATEEGVLSMQVNGAEVSYSLANGVLFYQSGGVATPITSEKYGVERFYLEQVLNSSDELIGVRVTLLVKPVQMDDMSFTLTTTYTL